MTRFFFTPSYAPRKCMAAAVANQIGRRGVKLLYSGVARFQSLYGAWCQHRFYRGKKYIVSWPERESGKHCPVVNSLHSPFCYMCEWGGQDFKKGPENVYMLILLLWAFHWLTWYIYKREFFFSTICFHGRQERAWTLALVTKMARFNQRHEKVGARVETGCKLLAEKVEGGQSHEYAPSDIY